MADPALKPCPRCKEYAYRVRPEGRRYHPDCLCCGMRGPAGGFRTTTEAEDWWNERPAEQGKPGPSAPYDCCVWACKVCGKRQTTKAKESWGGTCNKCKAEQPEPTRNAKDEPPHQCPYEGCKVQDAPNGNGTMEIVNCGDIGWLCDRCKEDRADARAGLARMLVDRIITLESNYSTMLQHINAMQENPSAEASQTQSEWRTKIVTMEELLDLARDVDSIRHRLDDHIIYR